MHADRSPYMQAIDRPQLTPAIAQPTILKCSATTCIGGFCSIMQEQSNLAALLTLYATYTFMAYFMTSIGSCQELARNKFAYKNLRNVT